jgi:hypothetical protein
MPTETEMPDDIMQAINDFAGRARTRDDIIEAFKSFYWSERVKSSASHAAGVRAGLEMAAKVAADEINDARGNGPVDLRTLRHLVEQRIRALIPEAGEPETRPADEAIRLRSLIKWAHDTLYEINPSNYDHDEVCRLNGASVEVILGLAPELGETHGKSAEWWIERAAAKAAGLPGTEDRG